MGETPLPLGREPDRQVGLNSLLIAKMFDSRRTTSHTTRMKAVRITIFIDSSPPKSRSSANRVGAAGAAAKKRMIRLRLARECAKLNKSEEQVLANEGCRR